MIHDHLEYDDDNIALINIDKFNRMREIPIKAVNSVKTIHTCAIFIYLLNPLLCNYRES